MEALFIIIGILIVIFYLILKPAKVNDEHRKRLRNIFFAHRGLHTKDKTVPENSLAAFEAAVNAGYGMELDLQLSKDGEVMVFHDESLKRICNIDKNMDDFTAEQLNKTKLLDTEQTIPYFKDVLKLVGGKTPLLVEIKPGKHRRDELCKKTYDLLKTYNGDFFIESFDPFIVAWFAKNAPEIVRGQLTDGLKRAAEAPFLTRITLCNVLLNIIARPHFIAHGLGKKTLAVRLCEALGALKVCWTVTDSENTSELHKNNDAVIFEFYKP